jgi:hypothetical protein
MHTDPWPSRTPYIYITTRICGNTHEHQTWTQDRLPRNRH